MSEELRPVHVELDALQLRSESNTTLHMSLQALFSAVEQCETSHQTSRQETR